MGGVAFERIVENCGKVKGLTFQGGEGWVNRNLSVGDLVAAAGISKCV